MPADADAAVYVEPTDFSNNVSLPTDLTGQFSNFLAGNQITGTVSGTDYWDHFKVSVTPLTQVKLNIRAYFPNDTDFLTISATGLSGQFLDSFDFQGKLGEASEDVLEFMSPTDGIVQFSVGLEGGGPVNYSVGAVPEPTTGLLGLAGLAASALHRRRKNG